MNALTKKNCPRLLMIMLAAFASVSQSEAADASQLQLFADFGDTYEALADGVMIRPETTLRLRVNVDQPTRLTVRLEQGGRTLTVVESVPVQPGAPRVVADDGFSSGGTAGLMTVTAELSAADGRKQTREWQLRVLESALPPDLQPRALKSDGPVPAGSIDADLKALDGRPPAELLDSIARLEWSAESQTRGAAEVAIFRQWAPGVIFVKVPRGSGSGVVINKKEGLAVTNWHVVDGQKVVSVVFKPVPGEDATNPQAYRAEVIRVDELADLALLRLPYIPDHVPELSLGELSSVEVGADVHAIGHPKGELWTYTKGLVSQIRSDYQWRTDTGLHKATVIQNQTPINPGNSGGPLLNEDGAVIGINSFARTKAENLNFAVSVVDIRAMLARSEDRLVAGTSPGGGTEGPGRGPNVAGPPAPGAPDGAGPCSQQRTPVDLDRDGRADGYSLDRNCDGRADVLLVDTNSDGRIDTLYIDRDGDGRPDVRAEDTDGDGRPDIWLLDENGDGKPDVVGQDLDGDGKPDSYRRVAGER